MTINQQLHEAAELFGRELREASFNGNEATFNALFDAYTKQWEQEDPHGRHAFHLIFKQPFGILSFRSTNANYQSFEDDVSLRWKLWLGVLPLDYQLSLLCMEADRRTLHLVDLDMVKWNQWARVENADDPDLAFGQTGMGEGAPGLWEIKREKLLKDAARVASLLINGKHWRKLDGWMERSPLKASTQVNQLLASYQTDSSFGQMLEHLKYPLPFWVCGVFQGAIEDEFWEVMSRHEGPTGPVPIELPGHPEVAAGPILLDFSNPATWTIEHRNSDRPWGPSTQKTAAHWQKSLLDLAIPSPMGSASKYSRRL